MIGSHLKLGKWKVQDGLKLSYAGNSIWQGDCVLRKGDLPIKYPFWCRNLQLFDAILYIIVYCVYLLIVTKSMHILSIFLDGCSTYKYSKYDKAGNFSLETGTNRELNVGSSENQPRYIFLSDGMYRVCYQT